MTSEPCLRDTVRGGLHIVNQRRIDEAEAKEIGENWNGWRQLIKPFAGALFRRYGHHVLAGPFKGMDVSVYKDPVWDDSNAPTVLVGSYEFELHDVMRKAIERKPDCVINAGCAEGYYAVGLARLLPQATIFAMDSNNEVLDACERNAWRNGVGMERFHTVVGLVSPQDLCR